MTVRITPPPELYLRVVGLCDGAGGWNKAACAALEQWCDRQEQGEAAEKKPIVEGSH